MESRLGFDILPQPDDSTCGPTCLQAVYAFYGDRVPLSRLVAEVEPLETGGTLAVHLACHALARGYRATIYTYNLELFDPTWFAGDVDLAGRLAAQARAKRGRKLRQATRAYREFLARGGRLRFEELGSELIRSQLERGWPILTGLSATYLYGCARERGDHELVYDDVAGRPTGHFVVLCGYDAATRQALVADPQHENPLSGRHLYEVGMERLLGAICLGVLTYDANLLVLEPTAGRGEAS